MIKYFSVFLFTFFSILIFFSVGVKPGCGCMNYDEMDLEVIKYDNDYFYLFSTNRLEFNYTIFLVDDYPKIIYVLREVKAEDNSYYFKYFDRELKESIIVKKPILLK